MGSEMCIRDRCSVVTCQWSGDSRVQLVGTEKLQKRVLTEFVVRAWMHIIAGIRRCSDTTERTYFTYTVSQFEIIDEKQTGNMLWSFD